MTIRRHRIRRRHDDWVFRPLPAEWWAAQQRKSIERMAIQDNMIENGQGLMGRMTAAMLRAGPLRTDEWVPAPSMQGIGRRLGRLSAAELEAEEFK